MQGKRRKHRTHRKLEQKDDPGIAGLRNVVDYVINLSDFQALGQIGQGAFGRVWKGQSLVNGWLVAVKELYAEHLDEKDLEFYRREVKILVGCDDEFLLDFIGFTMTPPYSIVTSFMAGGSLWDLLHNHTGHLNGTQKTLVAMGIAHGMRYLHERNVIHRDLKSPNILLDDRLLPKIADFGLGRFVSECESVPQMTGNIGTPIWMAPELLQDLPYSFPVDVYAYGMILYEMYTETVPFSGQDRYQIFNQVCQKGLRPDLPDNESTISRLISDCWHFDPASRPSFEEIYSRFEDNQISFPDTIPNGPEIFIHEVEQGEQKLRNSVFSCASEVNDILRLRQIGQSQSEVQQLVVQLSVDGQLEQLHRLLTAYVKYPELINGKDDSGLSPLHGAVKNGRIIIVEYIVRLRNVQKNIRDEDRNTPLIAAVRFGHPRIVGFLAQVQGVLVNAQNKYGMTALHMVAKLDVTWHSPMLRALALARDVRVDIEDWEHKTPFANHPDVIMQFQQEQQKYSCPKL
jgi:serine/threonine protein kinase